MKKEEVSKFYQTYKLYIFPAVVSLSALILIVFIIFPQLIKLIDNQKVSGENTQKLKILEVKAQALEGYDEEDLSNKLSATLTAYPVEKDFAQATGLLQDLVVRSGFSILAMSLGSGNAKPGNAQSYSVKLDLVGPQSQLLTLFNNIETSSRLMKVDTVETTVGHDNQAVVSLSIDILYAPAPTSFGSVDSPLPVLSEKDQEVLTKIKPLARTSIPIESTGSEAPTGSIGRSNPFE